MFAGIDLSDFLCSPCALDVRHSCLFVACKRFFLKRLCGSLTATLLSRVDAVILSKAKGSFIFFIVCTDVDFYFIFPVIFGLVFKELCLHLYLKI